jgi:calcineurin-like phosphoesterase family protein
MKYIIVMMILVSSLLNGLSIFDIQFTTNPGDGTYPSEYEGQTVTTGGIVTGTDYSNGRFFIGSTSGGSWNGLYIYNNDYDVSIGDSVIVVGEVYEYYGFTEINPANSVEIVSSGNPLPTYIAVSSWEAQNEEEYESVLIQLNDIVVTQEYDDWSQWNVDDGSGNCIISTGFINLEETDLPIIMSYPFSSINGIVSYTWGEFQLNPRALDDILSVDGNFIISVPEQFIYSPEEFEIPLNLTFFGSDQQLENYQFSLEYDPGILSFTQYDATNTLSEYGTFTIDEPMEGVLELVFEGEFSLSVTDILLKLNFTGISTGSGDLGFSEFEIDGSQVDYISLGQIYVQTETIPIGDTLTVIQKPILNVPEIAAPGEEFIIECVADGSTTDWFAELVYDELELQLPILSSNYSSELDRWFLTVSVPEPELYELYDLTVGASNLGTDTTVNAVRIIPEYKNEYSFIHITDTHLPTHYFYPDPESVTDASEMDDLWEVIEDINLINPEFVLITGDLINEGEMEDFENRRVYTKAQQLLSELEVPFYLTSGNHDIGGWYDSPPSQGTARRDWWRFFGWKWLQDPPEADPYYTQNYSFDYGQEHYVGMEAYINYDDYMENVYGDVSFTAGQMQWLESDLQDNSGDNNIIFYHMDFDDQINLNAMNIDMALYGHIHSNSGSIYNPPYNLSTEGTCDGERAYRRIKINNGVIEPQFTVSAGWSGDNLNVEYFPANDGTADSISAVISNQHSQTFLDARIKFLIPQGEYEYTIENGNLTQVNDSADPQVVYVSVDIPSESVITVTIIAEPLNSTDDDEFPQSGLQLMNYPNPFNPETVISFQVSDDISQDNIELMIFNLKGQKVKSFPAIQNQSKNKGKFSIIWDGTDDNDQAVPSGIFFYRIKVGGLEQIKKMVLLQ